jgi:hypothetical protein
MTPVAQFWDDTVTVTDVTQVPSVTCSYVGQTLGPSIQVLPVECPYPVTAIPPVGSVVIAIQYYATEYLTDSQGSTTSSSIYTYYNNINWVTFAAYNASSTRSTVFAATATQTRTAAATSNVATYTGAKSTKYVSCKKTKTTSTSSSSTSTVTSSMTLGGPSKRDVVTAAPVELVRITTTINNSTYKGPAKKTIQTTLDPGYVFADVTYLPAVTKKGTITRYVSVIVKTTMCYDPDSASLP